MSRNPGLVPSYSFLRIADKTNVSENQKIADLRSRVDRKKAKLRSFFCKFFACTRGNMGSNNQFVEGCIETKQLLNIGTYAYFVCMKCV